MGDEENAASTEDANPRLILSQDAGKVTGCLYMAGGGSGTGGAAAASAINSVNGDGPKYNALVLASSHTGISFCCNNDFGGGSGEISGTGVWGNEWAEGNQKMCITNTGKVGIATGDPSEMLEVVGNVKITGRVETAGFTLPNADGDPNQVIATDGAGELSWVAAGSGPQGTTGARGTQGTTGAQGKIGAQGTQGTTGAQGKIGAQEKSARREQPGHREHREQPGCREHKEQLGRREK